jgi:hypothetical protein
MLRDESNTKLFDRPYSSAWRVLTVFGRVGLTIGVATLRGPARGDDDTQSSAAKAEVAPPQPRDPSKSVVAPYVRESPYGMAVVRPAAAFRHIAMDRLVSVFQNALGEDLAIVAKELKVDTSRPGFLKIRCQDIEWITAGIGFDQIPKNVQWDKRRAQGGVVEEPKHRIIFGTPAVRMATPFDWLAFLRQWRCECLEVRVKGHVYYKITGNFKKWLGQNPCVFLPDDRAIVFDEEDGIRKIASAEGFAPPAYLRGKEWERASQGLAAITLNNQSDAFAKHYDLGRPDDAMVLPLFKGLDTWILAVEDADPIVLRADATCRDRDATDAVSRSLDSLIKMGRQYIEQNVSKSPDAGLDAQAARMIKALATNVRVENTANAITVRAQDFGTLADFATIVDGEAEEVKGQVATGNDAKNSVKQ